MIPKIRVISQIREMSNICEISNILVQKKCRMHLAFCVHKCTRGSTDITCVWVFLVVCCNESFQDLLHFWGARDTCGATAAIQRIFVCSPKIFWCWHLWQLRQTTGGSATRKRSCSAKFCNQRASLYSSRDRFQAVNLQLRQSCFSLSKKITVRLQTFGQVGRVRPSSAEFGEFGRVRLEFGRLKL